MTVHDPSAARRTLTGQTMRDIAQEGIRETVSCARKLSEANRKIGELERELDLADAEIHRLREGR